MSRLFIQVTICIGAVIISVLVYILIDYNDGLLVDNATDVRWKRTTTNSTTRINSTTSRTTNASSPVSRLWRTIANFSTITSEAVAGEGVEAFLGLSTNATTRPLKVVSKVLEERGGRRLCTRAEIRDGEWTAVNLSKPLYQPANPRKRCAADASLWARNQSSSWPTHVWEPRSKECRFLSFDATQFCTLLHNQTLALVGDSLMAETFDSLLYQIADNPVVEYDQMKKSNPTVVQICNNTSKLVFLIGVVASDGLSTLLREHEPNVIFLNQGAHYLKDDLFMSSMNDTVGILLQYKAQQRHHEGRVRIIWETSPPGHPQCWEFPGPVNDVSIMKAMIMDSSLYKFHPMAGQFYWWEFAHQTELLLTKLLLPAFNKSSEDQLEIVDGYELLLGRPDRHRGRLNHRRADCLHHCYPGPADVFPQLLNHYLHMTPQQVMTMPRNVTMSRNTTNSTHSF
jgi:hypothetical protein